MAQELSNMLMVLKLNASKVPVFKEEKNKDWIIYGADDKEFKNRYPDYLLKLFNRSSKHNAILTSKAFYIAGNGVTIKDEGTTTTSKSIRLDYLKQANKYGETISDIVYKCTMDRLIFGGFYLEVIWNKAGTDFEYYNIDYTKIRMDKSEDGYWYSNDWSQTTQNAEKTELEYIPKFDPENPTGRQLMCMKMYRPGIKYYPLPEYVSSIPYAEMEYEISNFWLNGIKSNFNAGTIVSFNNGRPTEEEKQDIFDKLQNQYTGTDSANSLLVMFNQTKENAPTVDRLQATDFDKQFDILNKTVQEELFIGHKVVNPMLMGVKTAGQLGGRNELIEAFELFKNTYVHPHQLELEKFFNKLFEYKRSPVKIKLVEVEPISNQLTENTLVQILTKNELRAMAGYPPIEQEQAMQEFSVQEFKINESELKALDVFKKYGKPSETYEFVNDLFADDYKKKWKQILEILKESPTLESKEIAKALKMEVEAVDKAIERMIEDGAIEVKKDERLLTEKAQTILEEKPVSKVEVMYSYGLNPSVSGPILLKTSRPFCDELVKANLLYSREDINSISAEVGWDVWEHRGGYWRQKGTDITRDYCRHAWLQRVVRKKA
jgi:DNA-binding MarR family transcriptional regulator